MAFRGSRGGRSVWRPVQLLIILFVLFYSSSFVFVFVLAHTKKSILDIKENAWRYTINSVSLVSTRFNKAIVKHVAEYHGLSQNPMMDLVYFHLQEGEGRLSILASKIAPNRTVKNSTDRFLPCKMKMF